MWLFCWCGNCKGCFCECFSVLGVEVGGRELTKFARDATNQLANTTPLIAAGICYLLITIPLLQLVAFFERRAKAGTR